MTTNPASYIGMQNGVISMKTAPIGTTTGNTIWRDGITIDNEGVVGIGQATIGVLKPWDFGFSTLQLGITGFVYSRDQTDDWMSIGKNAYYESGWKYSYNTQEAMEMVMTDGTFTFKSSPGGTAGTGIGWTQLLHLDKNGNAELGNMTYNTNSKGTLAISNSTTVPSSNPTGGGQIFVEAGTLKYIGTSGTSATIVNATGSNNVRLNNAEYVYGKIAAGTSTRMLGINVSDNCYVGSIDVAINNIFFNSGGTDLVRLPSTGGVLINEAAAASADVSSYGQVWVKNDTPNTLWFTDDTGVDYNDGNIQLFYLLFHLLNEHQL